MSKSKKDFIVVDLEMTCEEVRPKNYKPEIIEIGLVFMSVDGEVKKKEQIFVRPKHNKISKYCTDLTGHTPEFIKKNGIPYEEACRKLLKMGSKNKTIVAWGEDWKQFMMESEWKECDYPLSDNTLNLSLINSLFAKTTKKMSLEDAIEYWDIEPEGKMHCGLDDAHNTAKIFQRMSHLFPTF